MINGFVIGVILAAIGMFALIIMAITGAIIPEDTHID
jgi:hypothetical protein